MSHSFFIHSSVSGHLGCVHVLAWRTTALKHGADFRYSTMFLPSWVSPQPQTCEWEGDSDAVSQGCGQLSGLLLLPPRSFLLLLLVPFSWAEFVLVVKPLSHVPLFCEPINRDLPGSSVHGTSQARALEWVTIFFSRWSSGPGDQTHVSCIGSWIIYRLSRQGSPCSEFTPC